MGTPAVTVITFDSTTAPLILETFKDKFPLVCRYCKEPIDIKNLAGVSQGGLFCNNFTCLREYHGDELVAIG